MANPPGNPPSVPEEFTHAERGIRLQKALANAGVASRRACEELITQGRVRVNGQVIAALPAWVDPREDRLEVDGQELARPRKPRGGSRSKEDHNPALGKTTVMLHKPRGVLCTNDDPQGRKIAVDLITPKPNGARLFPVGRLDADSTGLLLLTDDGDLAQKLTHPKFGVTKRYLVSVKGRVYEEDLVKLRKGLHLADVRPGKPTGGPRGSKRAMAQDVRIIKTQIDRTRGDRTTLSITLAEGQNREIRRLFARLGFKVRKLKRVALGPLKLSGLEAGQWRPLSTKEVAALRRAAKPDSTA